MSGCVFRLFVPGLVETKTICTIQMMQGEKPRANMFGLIEECVPLNVIAWLLVVLHTIISK